MQMEICIPFGLIQKILKMPDKLNALIKKAKSGSPNDQFKLAKILFERANSFDDKKYALYWFKEAAKSGNPEALKMNLKGIYLDEDRRILGE